MPSTAIEVAESRTRPEPSVPYEPVFDPTKSLSTRLTDAADLLIDFATLGEYGIEPPGGTPAPLDPVGRTRQRCVDPSPAARRRPAASSCSLLEESGLCRPPTALVAQLRSEPAGAPTQFQSRGPRLR